MADLGDQHIAALHAALRDVVATAVEAHADASRYPKSWIFHSRRESLVVGVCASGLNRVPEYKATSILGSGYGSLRPRLLVEPE